MNLKSIKTVIKTGAAHMVGDGFKVKNYIDRGLWKDLSPFIMLDYMEPWELAPTQHPRGVDVHPHKGFETVTIVWEGALSHEDSGGGKGDLFAGDVQWMTAGRGIVHKEFHQKEWSAKGGTMHMAQLWVNLPARFKNTPAKYQDLRNNQFPRIALPGNGGELKLLAGEYEGAKAPGTTFTRINIYDIKLNAGAHFELKLASGDNTAIVVPKGNILVNGEQQARDGQMLVFGQEGEQITLEANNETHLLVLSGEPIDEPIAAYGPFVMNTQEEIMQAIQEFQEGKMGTLS